MIRARIRGIYSQSLTQILLQSHFDIVQPTPDIAIRFGLPYREGVPDVDIWDRSDLQGIVAIAHNSILTRLTDALRKRLGGVIVRRPRVAKSSIYRGIVLGTDEKTGHTKVDLGDTTGLLPDKGFPVGGPVMVQVRAHDYGRKLPLLSTNITIPGRSAVLLPDEPVVKLSTKIKNPAARRRLLQLGRRVREYTDNWGILWRTAAEQLTDEELRNEVDDLLDTAQQVYATYQDADGPQLLLEGTSNADIEFPAEVKEALDRTRSRIEPTVRHHHFYKSAGYSALVDFAEMLIEDRPDQRRYITTKLERVVQRQMPKQDDPINIEHVKLDGRNIILVRGHVVESKPNMVVIRRLFRHTDRKLKLNHYPDRVHVPRGEGDYAITRAVAGSPILVTDYFSRNGEMRGTYVNINTGVEIYPSNGNGPSRIRYVDLEVDVISVPQRGQVRIIDQHLLDRAVQRGFITEEMASRAIAKAQEIYERFVSELEKDPQST